jgi:hypothetical protein
MFRQSLDRQADDEQHQAEHQDDGAHHRQGDDYPHFRGVVFGRAH